MNNKLTSIKRSISHLQPEDIRELYRWMRKKDDEAWRKIRLKRKQEHMDRIKALPAGTKVIFTNSRYDLCGKIGTIVRHLERGSVRTVVDFGEAGKWRALRTDLDANVSKERIQSLRMCKNLGTVLNKALNKIS